MKRPNRKNAGSQNKKSESKVMITLKRQTALEFLAGGLWSMRLIEDDEEVTSAYLDTEGHFVLTLDKKKD